MGTWDAKHRQEHGGASTPSDSVASFRNLCRSSPWKWQSLRFEYRETPEGGTVPVRAWLRRPGALRLESTDGTLLHSTTGINDSRDGLYVSATRRSWLLPAHLVTPVYDDGGLVRRRPEAAYGEPSFGNSRFGAALDPVELAGNAPVPLEFPRANAVELLEPVREVAARGPQRPGDCGFAKRQLPPAGSGAAVVRTGPDKDPGGRRNRRLRGQRSPRRRGAAARPLDPDPGRRRIHAR